MGETVHFHLTAIFERLGGARDLVDAGDRDRFSAKKGVVQVFPGESQPLLQRDEM